MSRTPALGELPSMSTFHVSFRPVIGSVGIPFRYPAEINSSRLLGRRCFSSVKSPMILRILSRSSRKMDSFFAEVIVHPTMTIDNAEETIRQKTGEFLLRLDDLIVPSCPPSVLSVSGASTKRTPCESARLAKANS